MITPEPLAPRWLGVALAVASGVVLDLGFPDRGWWPATLLGIAMLLVAVAGGGFWRGARLGLLAGLAFHLLHLQWSTLFLGLVPWLALSSLMSLWFALGAGAIALAYRLVPAVWPGVLGRLLALPTIVAGLWTAREELASTLPYGGFAWGRVALSQSESPFAPLLAWVGTSGLGFLIVLLVALAIECVREVRVPALSRALVALVATVVLAAWPAWPAPTTGTLTVAAVQGNAKAGYFQEREYGDNLADQVEATEPVFGRDVDVVVWPEGASDVDPLRSEYGARVFDFVSEQTGAPLIAGTITQRDDRIYNTSLLWRAGEGAVDHFDKRRPIPFGEYVPDRAFWEPFAPDLIGLIQREYTAGRTDTIFEVAGTKVGVNICFDIVEVPVLLESARDGAEVIFAQTNNADFGRTDESAQQLAIARVRAIETGRSIVNVSTVGITAVLLADGSTMAQLEWHEPGALVEEVPLATHMTPAVAIGAAPAIGASTFGVLALLVAAALSRRRRG